MRKITKSFKKLTDVLTFLEEQEENNGELLSLNLTYSSDTKEWKLKVQFDYTPLTYESILYLLQGIKEKYFLSALEMQTINESMNAFKTLKDMGVI